MLTHPRRSSEFIYQGELDRQELAPSSFLGLAGIYLEKGQTERAVQLLRRMNLVAGEEFDTFVPAATLLAEHGHQPRRRSHSCEID